MLNLNSIIVGSEDSKKLADFYTKVFGKDADMIDGDWYGWSVGNTFISFGNHSEVHGKSANPQRLMFTFETTEVKAEFERIKALGATVIKEPYAMGESWICTLADPDGNYFQLMTPWSAE
jgi:predicted enzyme related to lactoylglutathione lyase